MPGRVAENRGESYEPWTDGAKLTHLVPIKLPPARIKPVEFDPDFD